MAAGESCGDDVEKGPYLDEDLMRRVVRDLLDQLEVKIVAERLEPLECAHHRPDQVRERCLRRFE
jgi:hypothetical protein